jgi:hypothetical protein
MIILPFSVFRAKNEHERHETNIKRDLRNLYIVMLLFPFVKANAYFLNLPNTEIKVKYPLTFC